MTPSDDLQRLVERIEAGGGKAMTEPTKAQIERAERIVETLIAERGFLPDRIQGEMRVAALAAIIETQEDCALIAERDADRSNAVFEAGIGGDAGKDRNAARYRTALRIAAAIREGANQ